MILVHVSLVSSRRGVSKVIYVSLAEGSSYRGYGRLRKRVGRLEVLSFLKRVTREQAAEELRRICGPGEEETTRRRRVVYEEVPDGVTTG